MNKQCQNCSSSFEITQDDLQFYKKIDIPPPTFCPDCRYQMRIGDRNEWNLYKRKCDLCEKEMVSIYNPDYSGPVYCQPCFWSDNWDARDFRQDFDFSRGFFEQFGEFRLKVPRIAITNTESVNSEYTNQSQENKNSYLIVASNRNEDCLYGNWYQDARYCVDCYIVQKSELVYESINSVNCYRSAYLENCRDCHSSYFLKDCHGAESCFGCVGLRNKKYCYLNEQLTKDAYEEKLKSFRWTHENIAKMRKQLAELSLALPHKYYEGRNNVDSSGDYIDDNKNTKNCFNCKRNENAKHSQDAYELKNCYDLTEVLSNELDYQVEGCAYSARNIAVRKSWHIFDVGYSELCFHSDHLFGCISLHKKKYCIFNKQYSKEEYKKIREKIVSHMKETREWGMATPIAISTWAYNETIAQDYFPLTKEQVFKNGWRWYDRDAREYQVTLKPRDIPEAISEVNESILKEVIGCESQETEESKEKYLSCTTAFNIVKAELDFYKKMGLPAPHKCFPCRRQGRLNLRNPRKLWERQCMCDYKIHNNTRTHDHHKEGKCANTFKTTYAPDRKEIVYCEACYNSEVV
jgi:hypothetical protein